MNEFFEKLAEETGTETSSEHLKLLGKRAAKLYVEKEASSLTDAVRSVLGEESLNRDQVQRVVEAANQSTWDQMFYGQGNSEAHFEPAAGDRILAALAESAVVTEPPVLDYYDDPKTVSSGPSIDDVAQILGIKEVPEYESLNPHGDAERNQVKTAAAEDLLRWTEDKLELAAKEASEQFYRMVKQAYLSGEGTIVQISRAVAAAVEHPEFAIGMMKTAAERLEAEGVVIDKKAEFEKLAEAVVVNHEHPLMQQAAALEKVAVAYARAMKGHSNATASSRRAKQALHDKFRGR